MTFHDESECSVASVERKQVEVKPVPGAEWARCRSLGHEWTHSSKPMGDINGGAYAFSSSCEFCGTKRTKYITRSGTLGGMRYEHPKDYSQHGDDRLSTQQWRRSFVVTIFGAN